DRAFKLAARRHGAPDAHHVDHLVAPERERLARRARRKLERQHAHADEIGAVDALEALGDHPAHAEEPRALGSPVARRAGAVLRAADHDEWYTFLAVPLGRGVERHALAAGIVHGAASLDVGRHLIAHPGAG